jgi:hypothetical protein
MTDIQDFTPAQVMAMGYKRIKSIADRFGINSPETLAACERWGGILDDVNYPDSTCSRCGMAVSAVNGVYYHTETKSKHCKTHAGSEAEPIDKVQAAKRLNPLQRSATTNLYKGKGWELGDSEPVPRTGVDPNPTMNVKPRTPRKVIKK